MEWVLGRDGALTALLNDGEWWSGCSVPGAAAEAMLKKMDTAAAVSCFLAPPHATHLQLALQKLGPGQAVIAVIPDKRDFPLMLGCRDFSVDIDAHRLWFIVGSNWEQDLGALLETRIGLAVPAQFLRMHSTDETLMQQMIQAATGVFSRITVRRSEQAAQLSEQPITITGQRRWCMMAPLDRRLWEEEGRLLRSLAPADATVVNTSDPASSSPLNLAIQAIACGALLAPNYFRADLPGVLPPSIPWFTWITDTRVPAFATAGPHDQLLAAGPELAKTAQALGWPKDRVHLAAWPAINLPEQAQLQNPARVLAVLADTYPLETPEDLEDFSSHRVLWQTLRDELAHDPGALSTTPAEYLESRMRQYNVASEGLPVQRFVKRLVVPAYQQAIVRLLMRSGLPVILYGEGWAELEEFHSAALLNADPRAVLAQSSVLIDVWPWREGHPIRAARRPMIRLDRSGPAGLVHRASRAVQGALPPLAEPVTPLSQTLLTQLLARI